MLTIVVDFGGVIHDHRSGWKGETVIPDPPVPGAVDFLARAAEHFHVAIVSSRFSRPGTKLEAMRAVREWLGRNGLNPAWITFDPDRSGRIYLAASKPPCHASIDDRAFRFEGTFPDPAELLAFVPWNKR